MADRSTLWAGLGGGGLLATCCGLPVLASAIGTTGIASVLTWRARAVLPIIGLPAVAGAVVLFLRGRRKHLAAICCDNPARPISRSL